MSLASNISRSISASVLFNWLGAEVVPETADKLSDRDGVGIVAHQPHDKSAILAQVFVNELVGLSLGFTWQFLHQLQVLLDVAATVCLDGAAHDPGEEAEAGHDSREHHPEPDEQVDLLVEQVDGQHALHGVTLHVAQPAHFEVAHGDAGKTRGLRPVLPLGQSAQHLNAVQVEVLAQESIQDEQLAHNIGNVEHLDEQVEGHQIVTKATAAAHATGARQAVFQADSAACLHFLLAGQIPGKDIGMLIISFHSSLHVNIKYVRDLEMLSPSPPL